MLGGDVMANQIGKVRATPAARSLAKDKGIALSKVMGSGPMGRIHKRDVFEYKIDDVRLTPLAKRMADHLEIDLGKVKGTGYKNKILKGDLLTEKQLPDIDTSVPTEYFNGVKGEYIPLNPMRKTVARRMTESYFQAPAFTIVNEVDMSEMISLRSKLKDQVMLEIGEKLTFTDLIFMAVAKTLRKHPAINSAWTDQGVYRYDEINIALAVGLDEGLYVPVIKSCDTLTLGQIAKETKVIARKAIENKLLPKDQENNTFTISNVGMFGVKSFTPIINMPSSAILGIGATIERCVPVDGKVEIKPIMEMCLTIDHRVCDGTPAAKFMKDLKVLMENPLSMFI